MHQISKIVHLILLFLLSHTAVNAQNKISYVEDLKQRAREQLDNIMKTYDLDDWIFTDVVKIVHGEDARSYPTLQMNTNHLDDDDIQLSIFIHENAHIFVADDEKDEAENTVIHELRSLFPNPPEPMQKNLYHHIMVVWLEYDGLIELFNEKNAREIINRKIDYYTRDNPKSLLSKNYVWYNNVVMDNPQKIGKLMKEFGFIIHSDKGIVVQ